MGSVFSKKKKTSEEEKYKLDGNDEALIASTYPKTNIGETMTLKSGRKKGYKIYGKLTNYRATILLFPGSPGTRLFKFPLHSQIDSAYGIRVIVFDRPGIGLSTDDPTFTFESESNDIYELTQHLKLESYHIVGYSAGCPFACVFCAMYSKKDKRMKSCTIISGVGPPECTGVYKQMTFLNKVGWFVVNNTSESVILFCADQDSKSAVAKPITKVVDDFGHNKYDKEMVTDPEILKCLMISHYETESTKTGVASDHRLLCLYGQKWGMEMKDIECPVDIYNGTIDCSCVPNMAKYMFEKISGEKAPSKKVQKVHEAYNRANNQMKNNDINEERKNGESNALVSADPVSVGNDDDNDEKEEKKEDGMDDNAVILNLENDLLNQFKAEYQFNELKQKVNNRHCKLIWGIGKGHLWFFEQDLWRQIVFRVLFFEHK